MMIQKEKTECLLSRSYLMVVERVNEAGAKKKKKNRVKLATENQCIQVRDHESLT